MDIPTAIAAIAALGVAAQGLVDSSKFVNGGISRAGFAYIHDALSPFTAALAVANGKAPLALVEANWINGVAKSEQKQTTLDMIRLGLTSTTASALAAGIDAIDGTSLAAVAAKLERGTALSEEELALLARFDSVIDIRLSAAYERAEQYFRNSAKVAAGAVAIVLSLVVSLSSPGIIGTTGAPEWLVAILIGLIAVPIAPVSKDLTSALASTVRALKLGKA